jgi:hypothetical protein
MELHCSLDQVEAEAQRHGIRHYVVEGEDRWNTDDLQRDWMERQRPAREAREGRILPPEVRTGYGPEGVIFTDHDAPIEAVLLSDTGSAGTGGRASKAISVVDAAQQAGLSEGDMTARLVGKAHLAMHHGKMFVKLADLQTLAKRGEIPRPSQRRKTGQPRSKSVGTDPTLEHRISTAAAFLGIEDAVTKPPAGSPKDRATMDKTERVAAALGLDLGTSKPATEPAEQTRSTSSGNAGVQVVTARDNRRRLGAPERYRPV